VSTANPLETYRADISIDGASVSVVASSMTILADLIARLKGAAPQAQAVSQAPKAPKAEKQASAPAAPEAPGKSDSAPPAAAPAAAQPQADASTQAPGVSYDDVKKVVNALYAIKPQHAIDLLKSFNVTKGPELQPQQWPDVVLAGQAMLAKVGG
jgi:hypothetical protein